MRSVFKFLYQLVSNSGGTSISTKRTMAWVLLVSALVVTFVFETHRHFEFVLGSFLSSVFALLGLTSVDYTSYISEKKIDKK